MNEPGGVTSGRGPVIAYSSARDGGKPSEIGSRTYSCRLVEAAMVGLLDRAGFETRRIVSPQGLKNPGAVSRILGAPADQVVHICFRSLENIRVLPGARNVAHVSWAFEIMKDQGLISEPITANQVHMLTLMDEIWVGCEFTRQVMMRYGLTRTYLAPAPIADDRRPSRKPAKDALDRVANTPCAPFLLKGGATREENANLLADRIAPIAQATLGRSLVGGTPGPVFLTILNPGNLNKNLINLIEGFQIANALAGSRATLIVKLAVSNQGDFRTTALFDHLTPLLGRQSAYNDGGVVFITDILSEEALDSLFSLSDYYLCASHCESYNRSLLRAMAFGTVPVTTSNTAMSDYISDENAVIIAERRFVSPIRGIDGDIAGRPYRVHYASRFDVAAACSRAMALDATEYRTRSDRAQETALERFGEARVLDLVKGRLIALSSQAAA